MSNPVFYVYPEILPTRAARGVSVANTVAHWFDCNPDFYLVLESGSDLQALNRYYNVALPEERVLFISKKLLLRSNKIFNLRLLKLLKAYPGCVVYTRHLKVAQTLLQAALPCRLFFEVHELFYESVSSLSKSTALRQLEEEIFRRAAGLVFWNKNLERLVLSRFSEVTERRLIANTGISPCQKLTPFVERGQDVLVYAGALKAWKGVDRLIQAFAQSSFSKLVILGGSAPEIAEHESLCDRLGVSHRVSFLGMLPSAEVQGWLAENAAVAVIPLIGGRYAEFSTPIKLVEYMHAGAVTVCPAVATVTDLVSTEQVVLFDQTEEQSLLQALETVAGMPLKARQALSLRAREFSMGLTWSRRARAINEFVVGAGS